MVQVDLITGFLGAGKTTFLRRYVRYLVQQGHKVCILENDFGAVNVDAMLVQEVLGPGCDVETISGGCDCDTHQRRMRTKLISLAMQGFDRVLVDAPCSGLGVLRRRAEARWRKQRKDLKLFPTLQLAILKNAAQYVKDGGTMVYSTCTIEQSENHYLVEEFLTQHPEWQRMEFTHPLTGEQVQELQLLPQNDGIDGFYICKLMKKQ